MITIQPVECIKLVNHALDQAAIDETADVNTYGGINVLRELALHFSTAQSKNVYLYKVKNGISLKIREWVENTEQDIVFVPDQPINLPDGWTPRLVVDRITGSLCTVNGHCIIQSSPNF